MLSTALLVTWGFSYRFLDMYILRTKNAPLKLFLYPKDFFFFFCFPSHGRQVQAHAKVWRPLGLWEKCRFSQPACAVRNEVAKNIYYYAFQPMQCMSNFLTLWLCQKKKKNFFLHCLLTFVCNGTLVQLIWLSVSLIWAFSFNISKLQPVRVHSKWACKFYASNL